MTIMSHLKWQIRDETGTIYEGLEEKVKEVWSLMCIAMDNHPDNCQICVHGEIIDFEGDLELLELHEIKFRPENDDRTNAEKEFDDYETAMEEKRDARKDDDYEERAMRANAD